MSRRTMVWAYLREKANLLLLMVVCALLLLMVCGLYGISLVPIAYSLLLMTFLGIVVGVADCLAYMHSLKTLSDFQKQAQGYITQLPSARGLEQELLLGSIQSQSQQCKDLHKQVYDGEEQARRYYTLWSHQIKTPLAAMRLLLQEGKLDARKLEQELFKTEQYVDMALQYQRLNNTENDFLFKRCSLDTLVKGAVKEVSTLFISKKIPIELQQLQGTVVTDEKWFGFIVEQILTNAVKYTPSGKVSVYNKGAVLYISDTGIGIAPEDLPRIFEWGYTGYNGREISRSTGIGLSLCKKAADMLGHTVTVNSKIGEGTTVAIDFARKQFDIE